jgi:uncharacterized membrane protein YhiD involved in acid resistance
MSDINPPAIQGLAEAGRLLVAACIGVIVVAVSRWTRRGRPLTRSMEQAHVLLCLAGALMMLIVGDSVARAFGIAGAAAIVRFRTPVEDPRDITVLFLLMALGMAAGLGLAPVAALGTAFVCGCLLMLPRGQRERPRSMKLALVADGHTFPSTHVSKVFAAHQIAAEPMEFLHGKHASVRYRAVLDRQTSIDEVSAQLLAGGSAGLVSVSWETPKKELSL